MNGDPHCEAIFWLFRRNLLLHILTIFFKLENKSKMVWNVYKRFIRLSLLGFLVLNFLISQKWIQMKMLQVSEKLKNIVTMNQLLKWLQTKVVLNIDFKLINLYFMMIDWQFLFTNLSVVLLGYATIHLNRFRFWQKQQNNLHFCQQDLIIQILSDLLWRNPYTT